MIKWIKGYELGILGKAFPNSKPYYRLEDKDIEIMENLHKEGMGFHPRCSSGLHIDFTTDSNEVYIRWEVAHCFFRSDVPISCESCIDAYVKIKNKWKYLNTCFIDQNTKQAERLIYSNTEFPVLGKGKKEFSVNLPTYDFIIDLEIGIEETSTIIPIKQKKEKPIVVYGTSITQGGHACRPGLSWPTWVRRNINMEVVNLGFSGSGRLEYEMTDILCKTDPKIMIMDSIANMCIFDEKEFTGRFEYFYNKFRKTHKTTPIIFMERPTYTNDWAKHKGLHPQNIWLKNLFEKWNKNDKNIYYVNTKKLYTNDGEGTVDGIHGSDASMAKITKTITKKILEIL